VGGFARSIEARRRAAKGPRHHSFAATASEADAKTAAASASRMGIL